MQRRKFMQQSILAGSALMSSSIAFAGNKPRNRPDEKPFHLNYGIHDGTFRNTVGDDFIEQIKYAHSIGFRAIEDNGMMTRPVDMQKKIGDTL